MISETLTWEEREKALKSKFFSINTFYLSSHSRKADVSKNITFTQFNVSAANEQHCFVFLPFMLKISIFFNS